MFFPFPFAICLSLVLLCLTVACPSCKPVCQYSWETSSLWYDFGYGELWHRVSSGMQTDIWRILSLAVPWFLWAGPSWARNLNRNGSLTCAHRCVSPPERPALSRWYSGMESCSPGSAPGTEGSQKDPVPDCSSQWLNSNLEWMDHGPCLLPYSHCLPSRKALCCCY